MKKVDTSNIIEFVRQLGATGVTLDHIISAVQETTDSIVRALTGNAGGVIVLYGCVNSGSGANYIISAGAVWYNGEIFLVDAFTGTTGGTTIVLSIVTTYDVGDPVKYSNNQNYYTHAIRKIAFSVSASGSGISDFSAVTRYSPQTSSNWTNLVLVNSWSSAADPVPQYRLINGMVELSGLILGGSAATFVNATPGLIPFSNSQMEVTGVDTTTSTPIPILIDTDGSLRLAGIPNLTHVFDLNGIRYRVQA